jgi:hypothetical protein
MIKPPSFPASPGPANEPGKQPMRVSAALTPTNGRRGEVGRGPRSWAGLKPLCRLFQPDGRTGGEEGLLAWTLALSFINLIQYSTRKLCCVNVCCTFSHMWTMTYVMQGVTKRPIAPSSMSPNAEGGG